MTTDLEEQLTRSMAQAVEETSLPYAAPVSAVRALQRRRGRRRAGFAAAWAVTAATAAVLTGTQLAAPEPQQQPAASPDRIPNFAKLPTPQKVWPDAVHRLPPTLPDGASYLVAAVLGEGRYLVSRGLDGPESAPSIFDTRTGAVTVLGSPTLPKNVTSPMVLMARVVGGTVVWIVEAQSNKGPVREMWAAPLGGGVETRLASLPTGSGPRFGSVGNTIFWEYGDPAQASLDGPGPKNIRSIPLSGGRVVTVKGTQEFQPTYLGPWLTDQFFGSGIDPKKSGELRNVETGKRLRWRAGQSVDFVSCGPTWCSGTTKDDRGVLQSLDGTDQVKLPAGVHVEPAYHGRFATGAVDLGEGKKRLVWDRATGKAASYPISSSPIVAASDPPRERRLKPGIPESTSPPISSDLEPEVMTVGSTDDELIVLDLAAIK